MLKLSKRLPTMVRSCILRPMAGIIAYAVIAVRCFLFRVMYIKNQILKGPIEFQQEIVLSFFSSFRMQLKHFARLVLQVLK